MADLYTNINNAVNKIAGVTPAPTPATPINPTPSGNAPNMTSAGAMVFPGVSPAVSAAATAAGITPKTPVNNKTISGSGSQNQKQSTDTAMNSAVNSVTGKVPVPAYGSVNPDGSVNKFDPNTGKPLVDPNAGKTTVNTDGTITLANGTKLDANGKPISTPTTDTKTTPTVVSTSTDPATGNVTNTMSDGTIQNIPVSVANAPIYTQAQNAKDLEIQQYNNNLAAKQAALQANIDALKVDKTNAIAAASTEYAKGNPEGSGSDKAQYIAGVGSKYDKAISEATFDMNTQLTNLDIAHKSALNDIDNKLSTAIQTGISNAQSAGKADYTEWSKGLAGDGSDDPTVGAQALMAQNTGNPSFTWDVAMSQSQSAINKQTIATDKTLSAEERANATAASGNFYKAIGQLTTPFEQLPQAAQMNLIDLAIQGKVAPDATSAYATISSLNKGAVQAANTAQRTAIAAENANKAANKQGWDKATVLEQVGVQKYALSGVGKLNFNGKDVDITSATLEFAKTNPDMFNSIMAAAIKDGFIVESSIPE